jgi:hypothetical protein
VSECGDDFFGKEIFVEDVSIWRIDYITVYPLIITLVVYR